MDRGLVGRCIPLRDDVRLKEIGTEIEFREQFIWRPDEVEVSVDFWADEAVERYWLTNVAACPCRD